MIRDKKEIHGKIIFGLFCLLFSILLIIPALAESDLPPAIQKIIDYNLDSTKDIATKVSFFVAFLAGMLGVLSPCILPFLPAYFSFTFKEKKNITLMTLIFGLGFSIVFVTMGIVAGFIGERSLSVVQLPWLFTISGFFLIIMGLMSIAGKGFSGLLSNKKFSNDIPGTFLFGMFYAIGWSACLGPILVGILGIGALLHEPIKSGLLLLFYSIGNLVPLFILALFYDKFNLGESRFIQGWKIKFKIDEKVHSIDSTKLISGLLFIGLGLIILFYQGTIVFNTWDIFGTKEYFYSIQNGLINWQYANIVSVFVFALFVIILGGFFWLGKTKQKN